MYTTKNWDAAFNAEPGTKFQVAPEVVLDNEATVIEVKHRARDPWGEAFEGEGECYIIFQVGDRFFKKSGYESSYDETVYWDEDESPIEVQGEVVTTISFRPKEK